MGYRGTFVLDVEKLLHLGVDISEKIKPHEWEKAAMALGCGAHICMVESVSAFE